MGEYEAVLKEICQRVGGSMIPAFLEGHGKEEDGIQLEISFTELKEIQISSYVGGKKKGYYVKIFLDESAVQKMSEIFAAEKEKIRIVREQRRLQAEQSLSQMRDIAQDSRLSDQERLKKLLENLNV